MRCNEQIRLSPIRLIDQEGTQHGIVPTDQAMRMARDAGLDLVEVSPNERPPVCKIMDYGKHKYLLSKKSKQKHHEQKIKEVRIRPKTDPHDKAIKMKHAREFLLEGDRVQFTMRFRGRERFHKDIGMAAFAEIATSLADLAKIERPAMMLGQRMTMVLVPLKVPAPKPHSQPKGPPKTPRKPKDEGGAAPSGGDTVLNEADLARIGAAGSPGSQGAESTTATAPPPTVEAT